jgi:hypothetical protein
MGVVGAVEPSERYAHLRNAALLRALKRSAVQGKGDVYDLDGYELHTHPDLCEHLESLNRHCYGGAYGVSLLANDLGVIFAVARARPSSPSGSGSRSNPRPGTTGFPWRAGGPTRT